MFNRKLVFSAACLGMFAFGIVLMTLGSILPSLIERFALDKTQAGLLVSLQLAAILVGSLLMGPLADRYGFKAMLAGSCALALLGLEGIAFAAAYPGLLCAIVATGVGGGIINGGTNAVVAEISEEGRSASLSLLGVFFGIGAVGVPLMLAILLGRFSYSALLAAAALTLLLPIALTVAIAFPPAKQPQGPVDNGIIMPLPDNQQPGAQPQAQPQTAPGQNEQPPASQPQASQPQAQPQQPQQGPVQNGIIMPLPDNQQPPETKQPEPH